MSPLPKKTPIATCIGDLHLSLSAPACRADEDWLETQARYLQAVRSLKLPVLCAGDLFDRWNPVPELLVFALVHLPDEMLCVPGQHDLPHHRVDRMERSGYGVLKQAGKIRDLSGGKLTGNIGGGYVVRGFGWGEAVAKGTPERTIALIHRYVWVGSCCYAGAPDSSHVSTLRSSLQAYRLAVTGDNHIPFEAFLGRCLLFNCGTFIRRKRDEIVLRPSMGIIYDDGTVERRYFDTSKDHFYERATAHEDAPAGMKEFIEDLESLDGHSLSFRADVENFLRSKPVPPAIRDILLTSLEEKHDH